MIKSAQNDLIGHLGIVPERYLIADSIRGWTRKNIGSVSMRAITGAMKLNNWCRITIIIALHGYHKALDFNAVLHGTVVVPLYDGRDAPKECPKCRKN